MLTYSQDVWLSHPLISRRRNHRAFVLRAFLFGDDCHHLVRYSYWCSGFSMACHVWQTSRTPCIGQFTILYGLVCQHGHVSLEHCHRVFLWSHCVSTRRSSIEHCIKGILACRAWNCHHWHRLLAHCNRRLQICHNIPEVSLPDGPAEL